MSAIESMGKGFLVKPSYISPGIYKTNAPIKAVYDFIKCWKKKDMPEDKYISPSLKEAFGIRILKKEIEYQPDLNFKSEQKLKSLPHFQKMGKNMGPKGKPMSRVL